MGAWGAGNLENDSALDWVGDLADITRPKLLKRPDPLGPIRLCLDQIEKIIASDEYLDAPEACETLAAGEAICIAGGHPGSESSESLEAWALRVKSPEQLPDLAARCATCAAFVRDNTERSELRQLWEDGDDLGDWISHVDDLIQRLQKVAGR